MQDGTALALDGHVQMLGFIAYACLTALGVKTLLVLVCACLPRRGRLGLSMLFLGTLALVLLFLADSGVLTTRSSGVVTATLGYYLVVSGVVFRLARHVRTNSLKKDVLFAVVALLYVFAPAFFVRSWGALALLTLGWKLALSSYSYCVESVRMTAPRFSEFMFFAWIDPALSYPERSRSAWIPQRTALKRLITGASTMIVGQQVLSRWPWLIGALSEGLEGRVPRVFVITLSAAAFFFPLFWLRAGAASVRIALMQASGYQTPECFKEPYRANSPSDFWRRWNCWVGAWLKRYVFTPFSLWMIRRSKSVAPARSTLPARVVALLGSFVVMGALHDWLTWAAQGMLFLVYVRVFAFAAVGLLVWEAIAVVAARRELTLARWSAAKRMATAAYGAAYICIMVLLATTPPI
jgi:predicted phage tail protein